MIKQVIFLVSIVFITGVTADSAVAHRNGHSLDKQIKICSRNSDRASCGFGKAWWRYRNNQQTLRISADDTAEDGHCTYGKYFKGRNLTVKSCGAVRTIERSNADPFLTVCITGHWWCR